ncbi:hypothetical protein GCM10025867_03600 [Frondihabitans sucicola]|uniref:Uncharacterized protein n=1 Tax=Frondihabitans sucicola TaxID=1268041 RepID=A0ABN6XSZ8_9MICO|nr:hypothetical protein [Frondihabitans sucicola]BDZ48119.1 hypothetical protein GCM10025867_03600 [Frondihabitans sucicola]
MRQTLDTTTYGEHLARSGPASLPFDRFLAQRSAESWSFTGRWPADQNHLGVTEQFRIPESPTEARGRRIGTAIFAAVAGIALVAIAVNAFGSSQAGSGAGSAAFGSANSTGGSTSVASGSASLPGPAPSPAAHTGPPVSALVLNPATPSAASCVGTGDCFVVRVEAAPSCSSVTLIVQFYASSSATVADRYQTLSLPITGTTFTDVAVAEPSASDAYADVADSYCSVG